MEGWIVCWRRKWGMEGIGGRNDNSLEFELISHFSDFVWFIFSVSFKQSVSCHQRSQDLARSMKR